MNQMLKLGVILFSLLWLVGCYEQSLKQQVENVEDGLQQEQAKNKILMSRVPLIPADLRELKVSCSVKSEKSNLLDHKTSAQINYHEYGWEKRLAKDWNFFSATPAQGKILLIDTSRQAESIGYRYLSNDTQNELFEPWSSSKVMAISAAMAKANSAGLQRSTNVGSVPLADLVTSIHSYTEFGKSKSSSNAIATYFVDLVGRDKLTNYFFDDWLKLSNKKVRIKGGYGEAPYKPIPNLWFAIDQPQGIELQGFKSSYDDPMSQSYRCEECGLTGNKPQTTLSMAEWIKRLALHDRDNQTNMPELSMRDIEVLFYGKGHSQKSAKVAGMMQGVSQNLASALATTINNDPTLATKDILDNATNGQWRIWQKIGWGPSETRGAAEFVLLAHVCLPYYQGGREFSLSAQVAIHGATEGDEAKVSEKMQSLLIRSMQEYFGR